MTAPDHDADADFAERLLSYDEALKAGTDPPDDTPVSPEVQARLAGALDCLRRLRRQWHSDRPGDSASVPSERVAPGAVLGRFQIERPLGRGGQGVVYQAWDPRLRRRVALKVARPELLADAGLLARFRREAEAAAGLDHPNLVPVYEVDQSGPWTYIVSAYCDGPSLADWLRQRAEPVPVDVAARLVADLAEAVAYVHGRGVLHRDLKPSNVLLSFSRAPGASALAPGSRLNECTPKITDFGLARVTGDSLHHTQTGTVLGTPAYMSPEQAAGGGSEVGPATDIYALGVVLYELLTGRPPFVAPTALDTLRQVLSEEPIPPRALRRPVPRDLETVCLCCLRKTPGQRYPSARALADDLHRFLDRQPVQARRTRIWERSWRRARRHPALLTAAALLLGFAAVWAFSPRREAAAPAAPLSDDERDEQAYRQATGAAEQALLKGETVPLIRPDSPSVAYRWRFGQGRVMLPADPGGGGRVVVQSAVPSLVELLPAVDCPALRIRVEMRQEFDYGGGDGDLGVYFAHRQYLSAEGDQHFCQCAVFADIGKTAAAFRDPAGRAGSHFALKLGYYGNCTTSLYRTRPYGAGGYLFYAPANHGNAPGEWRQFSVELRPDGTRADWAGKTITLDPTRGEQRWLAPLRRDYPDLADLPIRLTGSDGGIGLYLNGASLSVRQFTVEPLSEPRGNP